MKNNVKVISAGLAGILIGGITVVGANEAVRALQNTEIKVSLNGQVQEFKDETTGERQYPLTYNNRTYLPLRNVANLAGLKVDYDSNSNTAILNSEKNEDFYLVDIDGDSQKELIINAYNEKEGSTLNIFKKENYTGSGWKKLEPSEKNIHRNMFALNNVLQTSNGVYIFNNTGETGYSIEEISKIEIADNKYVLTSVFAEENDKYYIDGKEVSHEEYISQRQSFENSKSEIISTKDNYTEMEKILNESIKDANLIVDIDKNGIPEAIKLGSVILGEIPFDVYTVDDNRAVSLSMLNPYKLSNVFAIYETEDGVYVYENDSDGPEEFVRIYKLLLVDNDLILSEVLGHRKLHDSSSDSEKISSEEFFVDSIPVTIKEYNDKIDELNKIKIIDKNEYREEKNVGKVDYENLWN